MGNIVKKRCKLIHKLHLITTTVYNNLLYIAASGLGHHVLYPGHHDGAGQRMDIQQPWILPLRIDSNGKETSVPRITVQHQTITWQINIKNTEQQTHHLPPSIKYENFNHQHDCDSIYTKHEESVSGRDEKRWDRMRCDRKGQEGTGKNNEKENENFNISVTRGVRH